MPDLKTPRSDLPDLTDLPSVTAEAFEPIDVAALAPAGDPGHAPRVLLLYGSLRDVSYSRKVVEECARILKALGCEPKIFDPSGLPFPDDEGAADHPKVAELRALAIWSEAMVWSSPERHGAMTGIMKTQIDHIPLAPIGGIRPTQGKTLAIMQVCGGSQSFNAVNQMRILGRWMRMVTIPNQSSIPKAFLEYQGDRLPEGPYYRRVVDVMEELVKFTWLVRGRADYMVDRYSERVESAEALSKRVNEK